MPFTLPALAQQINDFWFSDRISPYWFSASKALDDEIRTTYENDWLLARTGAFEDWLNSPYSALALIILLDQFPLNMFRGQPESFITLQQAIEACYAAFAKGYDRKLPKSKLVFLFMPLMHSEDIADQYKSVELFEKYGLDDNLRFAKHHQEIVQRFGRFPHRNAILGRENTPEEIEYLNSDNAFKG